MPQITKLTSHLASLLVAAMFSSCEVVATDPDTKEETNPCIIGPLRSFGSSCAEPTKEPQARRTLDGEFHVADSSRMPDSVQVKAKGLLAQSTLTVSPGHSFVVAATFANDVPSWDTAFVDVYTKSIRFAQLKYVNQPSDWVLVGIVPDSIAYELLTRLQRSQEPKTDSGLRNIYAAALVVGDSIGYGFPQSAPMGIDLDKVRESALRQAVRSGKPLQETSAHWHLDLDYPTAKSMILALEPRISSSDSALLFP